MKVPKPGKKTNLGNSYRLVLGPRCGNILLINFSPSQRGQDVHGPSIRDDVTYCLCNSLPSFQCMLMTIMQMAYCWGSKCQAHLSGNKN
ncbi:hypothetical protein DERF_014021 [Dermatophagoides farinae]|uniref:Uncharacterized protein n=1 Tax=Dermatophagoides farinae TaxID=6954 RepID=A0A922HRG2_DERFA|nr:hypothetical protein DERF_014021 [Dermatophagoides farinae]